MYSTVHYIPYCQDTRVQGEWDIGCSVELLQLTLPRVVPELYRFKLTGYRTGRCMRTPKTISKMPALGAAVEQRYKALQYPRLAADDASLFACLLA